ncbi:hypothetical protein HDV05_002317 [Chytridiales sp. JEL 0842]|nr:hypothetical protein HDV05_002317 [Chytridiales sp. JEL 0842]
MLDEYQGNRSRTESSNIETSSKPPSTAQPRAPTSNQPDDNEEDEDLEANPREFYELGGTVMPSVDYSGLRKSAFATWAFTALLVPSCVLSLLVTQMYSSFFVVKPFSPKEEIRLGQEEGLVLAPIATTGNTTTQPKLGNVVGFEAGFSQVCIIYPQLPNEGSDVTFITNCWSMANFCTSREMYMDALLKSGVKSLDTPAQVRTACQFLQVGRIMSIFGTIVAFAGWWSMWVVFSGRYKRFLKQQRRKNMDIKKSGMNGSGFWFLLGAQRLFSIGFALALLH